MLQKVKDFGNLNILEISWSRRLRRFLFSLSYLSLLLILGLGLGDLVSHLKETNTLNTLGEGLLIFGLWVSLIAYIYMFLLGLVGLTLVWSPKDYVNTIKKHFDF